MRLPEKLATATLAAACLMTSGATSALQAAPLPLAIQADTVLSGPCVLSSRFKPEDKVIFRVRVTDTVTGEAVAEGGLQKLVVLLADGTEFAPKFGPHPPDPVAGYYWTYAWTIPADFPTGSLPYKVIATSLGGEVVTFTPFEAPKSQLTIVAAQ
jgi:hypothetical protein